MKVIHMISFILLVVGGLNWGLVGIFDFNLVTFLFGEMSMISKIVYILVGASAVFEIITHPMTCKACTK